MRETVLSDNAPRPSGPFSQGIITSGRQLWISGQVGSDPKTKKVVPGGIEEQAVQVFENVKAIAEAGGGSLQKAIRVGVYLTDIANWAQMNEIYKRYFSEPFPVRTTISCGLVSPYLIEVDAVIALD
ncbi:MAG: Rid family detoxifying hydrolase [Anaerolineae bacterium]|nr:Rid family detoxifying hydrolase [Anaerolineae bacterium]